ncbi:DUF4056 domain-containing protein [Buttiauxella sp. WJP83]|uniref:DUF4056 domain-containing protein n=1 Tax=Buttiauxella sp. WJP83 TaxID=2986951 RepID=UPI0022DD0103|nr:DUF4056 domain-containing protein [Buttiauxella sp. WJP83]WBM70298.1 DUF4056 domain-containing protein [Buttiauxella sp. WJP83]
MRVWIVTLLLGVASLSYGAQPQSADILPIEQARRVWPVAQNLIAPESLRPCCAFGYDLQVRAVGVPIPVYQIGNILTLGTLGQHRYNDSALGAVKNIVGLSEEKSGLIYTHRGGFIDIAHVRDTADNTFYLFSQIYSRLGQDWRLFYSEELGVRRIQLHAFTPPASMVERYTIAAWLAGHLAFQLAQWHEIAQWYGFESVPGFPEEISAFSPEDLYSNLLGARLAINVILHGNAGSVDSYNKAMDKALHKALVQLGAVSKAETERQFRAVDGDWWNSKRRVPDKFLVLNRNYDLSENRYPTKVPFENTQAYRLEMPATVAGVTLSQLGELQIHTGSDMHSLKAPERFYLPSQFSELAEQAKAADQIQLQRMNK